MNQPYPKGKEKLLAGGIFALVTDTIKAALVTTAYTPAFATDEFYSILSAFVIGTPQTLTAKSILLGVFDAADVTFPAVPAGSTALGVVIYKDTGVAGTSPLLGYVDVITGFPVGTNGGNLQVVWDNGAFKIFSL